MGVLLIITLMVDLNWQCPGKNHHVWVLPPEDSGFCFFVFQSSIYYYYYYILKKDIFLRAVLDP